MTKTVLDFYTRDEVLTLWFGRLDQKLVFFDHLNQNLVCCDRARPKLGIFYQNKSTRPCLTQTRYVLTVIDPIRVCLDFQTESLLFE